MEDKVTLTAEKQFEVRFSEVDMMGVVWHGAYPVYLEDAREEFGARFGLSYSKYIEEMIFAPVVDLRLSYRRPLRYGMKPVARITYRPTEAAKILFDYEIYDPQDGTVYLTASSVQVFMNPDYELLWDSPEFSLDWKRSVGLL